MADFDINNSLGVPSVQQDDVGTLFATSRQNAQEDRDDIEALFGAQPANRSAELNIKAFREGTPEQYSKQKKTADKLGVPLEVVEAAPEAAADQELDRDLEALFGEAPATRQFYERAENARIAHDVVEELSTIERITRGFERGRVLTSLGRAGYVLREAPQDPTQIGRVAQLQERLRALGEDTDGFVSAFAGASEVLGQIYQAFGDPRAPVAAGAGASAGAAAGLLGGPFAPITSAAGAGYGFASGLAAQQIMTAGEVEAGLSYIDQMEAGVDPDVAYWTSLGVGVANASLEAVGDVAFAKPLAEAGKRTLRLGARNMAKDPRFLEAMRDLALNYGGVIAAETATEVTQEAVSIAAEELGKELTEGNSAEWTPEEWGQRLAAITEKTLKASAVLAAPGAGANFLFDVRKIRQARADLASMDEVRQAVQQSTLASRDADAASEHVALGMRQQGLADVYISVSDLDAIAQQQEDPEAFYGALGVVDQLSDARVFNGDVRIPVKNFAQHAMLTDTYDQMKDFVKLDPEGISASEAAESQQSRELDAAEYELVTRVPTPEDQEGAISQEDVADVDMAEHQVGMRALFTNAQEAGLTEGQFASYLAAVKNAKQDAATRLQRRRLKRLQQRNEAQYQQRAEGVRQQVAARLSQEPLYQAQLSIGRDRLDHAEVVELLNGEESALAKLPKVNGRRIYTPKGEKGISPRILADLYGFDGGDVLLYQFMDYPSFEEAVSRQTEAEMEQQFPTLLTRREKISAALESLHQVVGYEDTIAYELNQIRTARKMGKLKKSLVKARARKILEGYKISSINVRQLEATQNREAKRARKALRSGDLDTAAQAKLNQLVAYEMTKEAYSVRDEIQRGNKFMRKFGGKKGNKLKNLPVDSYNAIRDMLADYQLVSRLSDKRRKTLLDFAEEKYRNEGIVVAIPDRILREDRTTNYQDLSLVDWRALRDTAQTIYKEGLDENKLRLASVTQTRAEIVDTITERLRKNVSARVRPAAENVSETTNVSRVDTMMQTIRDAKDRYGVDATTILLNTDSLLRNIDGFEDLGPAYTYLKGGIDRAITEGYQPGQVGYTARLKIESQKLLELFDAYSKSEKAAMGRQQDIPGVRARLTRLQQLSVLLNMGNAENRQAMLEGRTGDGSPQFTEAELEAVVNNASKKDLDFVQGVWDYLETLWPEIHETSKRRYNRDVTRVEPSVLETRFGTYRGGYFPLRYDQRETASFNNATVEEARNRLMSGGFTASHTQNTHTMERTGSAGKPVLLDPFVLNSHVQQVVYDLEVGDAVIDTYKILHHKNMKQAFADLGRKEIWEALDVWLGDVVTGEVQRPGVVEAIARHIRTGTTITALGFNAGVALLQPLGLIQSTVQVGKGNMLQALWDIAALWMHNNGNPVAVFNHLQWVTEQSGFMRERERSFNKDIMEAQRGLRTGWLAARTPGRTTEYMTNAAFMAIAKMQRMVDYLTWTAAYKKGLDQFQGDTDKSTQFADRMVARSQGSGNFQERTAFERGTINRFTRQSEWIKVWSLFLNYFAAKLNVAYERTKKTSFTNPLQIAHWATDMTLLFAIEGLAANIIREGWPDEDDERDIWGIAASEGMKSLTAGVPLLREVTAASEGFATGGSLGSFAQKVATMNEQISQGEMDEAALKSINNILGTLFKYPTSQVHKTGGAILRDLEGEDVEWYEYIMGPKYE